MLRLAGADGEECSVRLVIQKTGTGVRWVVVRSEEEIARQSTPYSVLSTQEENSGDDFTLRVSGNVEQPFMIPWMCAVADPQEKWWLRLRGNPKRSGEISQAAFLLRAETMGFNLALPWGDNQAWDFVVWGRDERAVRVQVKGTGRLHRRGYEVQPVRTGRRGRKKRYTKKDIDVIAAHVQPVDAWYLIPIEKVGRAKSLRLYPGIESRQPMWERYRDAWEILGVFR